MSSAPSSSRIAEERSRYAKDLEELLRCPTCRITPTGPVRMCKIGHHLCEVCWKSLNNCPTCKTPFSRDDGHSFLADKLRNKLDDFSFVFAPMPIPLHERTVDCRIGLCPTRLTADKMPDHVRNVHPSNLLRMAQSDGGRTIELHLAYGINSLYSYLLEAEGLGMFFFVVFIDHSGNAQMEIQVAYSCYELERFKYFIFVHYPNYMLNSSDESQCAFGDEKGAHVYKVGKQEFTYYYKDAGILDEKKKEPFTVVVQIEKRL